MVLRGGSGHLLTPRMALGVDPAEGTGSALSGVLRALVAGRMPAIRLAPQERTWRMKSLCDRDLRQLGEAHLRGSIAL